MDLNLASLIKSALIMAFMLPAFSIMLSTLPTTPAPVFASANNTASSIALSGEMNSSSLYIQRSFLSTVSGLNTSLNGKNGSFSSNPTIYTAFAFILSGFGTFMQSIVMVPYIDLASMNFLAKGMEYALPPIAVGVISIGFDMLYAYMVFSLLVLGVSIIEKFDAKSG